MTQGSDTETLPPLFYLPQPHLNSGAGCCRAGYREQAVGMLFHLLLVTWLSCSSCYRSRGGVLELALAHSYKSLALHFSLSSSLHLYLHSVYKRNQLIKLPFHTICYVSQTLFLQKRWEGSFKTGNFQNSFKLYRQEAKS